MARYFQPEQTPDKRNYSVLRRNRAGMAERYQLPQEGIYTETEMSRIVKAPPGQWLDLDKRDTAYIFGLRQISMRPRCTLVPERMEVAAPRNGKPSYRWAQGYLVDGCEYPPLSRNEAYSRARQKHGANVVIKIMER